MSTHLLIIPLLIHIFPLDTPTNSPDKNLGSSILSKACLSLAACVKQVLKNGLAIMNISALDKMY